MTNPYPPTMTKTADTPAVVTPTQAPVKVSSTAIVKSFSIWGAVLAVIGWLLNPQILALLPNTVSHILTAIGIVLSIFGFRTAISKNGTGQ